MATTAFILTFTACILLHDSWAQQLGRVPPAQIRVRNPGEQGLSSQISISNPGERGLIPSQPFFPESQSPANTNQDQSVHHQEHSKAHLEQVQGEGIAVQDHAYRVSAPGTAKPLAPVVLQALRAIQPKWTSSQVKPLSLKEEDHLNQISKRRKRQHRRAQRLIHPLQRPLTEFHGLVASVRPSSQNMDVELRSIVPEHAIDKFRNSPTKPPVNHLANRPQTLNTVTSQIPIRSTSSRTQHSDLELLLHSGISDIKSQVRHPLLDPQFQTRPVAPPTTGFLHTDAQKQSNNHLRKNQTNTLTIKDSSKLTEPFLAVFEQFSPNSKAKEFPDYDDEEYYYYDDYDDTYYDDYDYGLSGGPITPLPFHATTTNHIEPTVTTTPPSVTTRSRSRGPITPPPSLFPVRPAQTASSTAFPFPSTKQPSHISTDSKAPISFGFNNEKKAAHVHHVTLAPRIVEVPVTPRHQVFNALPTPSHILIQQPHPLHEFFIGDTSSIQLKQSRRFPTSTDIKNYFSCAECSTNPDKVIFPASPPGLRAPLTQDPKRIFNPDGSQTLVLSSHLLHRLHHSHLSAVPDQQPIYFTPQHSVSQSSSNPLKRLRRRKRRRYPSDYNTETKKKRRGNRVPQNVEKTYNSSSNNKIASDLIQQNQSHTLQSHVRESSIQYLKNETGKKLALNVDFSRRNPTRKSLRINNKTNSSLSATLKSKHSTNISPASYDRLPLPGLTASKQKSVHIQPTVGGITGNYKGYELNSPFRRVPTLESASPEEITRAASEAVQGWRHDLRYPVVELPLPSAALSGLPFVIDGHKHLGTFVVVPVT